MSAASIPLERYAERLTRARAPLPAQDASALLIGAGTDLEWLIGYEAMPLERLTMLVVPAQGTATLIVPRLEVAAAQASPGVSGGIVELVSWEETEDPFGLVAQLLGATKSRPEIQLGALGGTWGRLGGLLVSDRLWASFLLRLQAAVPDAAFGLASSVLGPLRAVKDEREIELLRNSAHAADRVMLAIAATRLIGRSEADVAREVRARLVDEGHDEAFAIIASGPNSASPHHEAADRVIAAGDAIVFDIGGRRQGYFSDISRTMWVTGDEEIRPDDQFIQLYDVLQRSQAEARGAVAPGASCESIDSTAREIIAAAGYGANFIHRTGHGIGLEVHEEPYLVQGNEQLLEAGHAFSVEPGIYLEGRHGARIEDIVVCSGGGADVLNQTSRELLVVRGS